jgi:hypothetical protein
MINQINADMEKLQNRNIWSWKDKLIAVWVAICIIGSFIISLIVSTLILTFFINSREVKTESQCVPLEEKLSKRLLSNNINLSEASLVKIISQTESTTILAPRSSYLYDELNNSYQIIGPYELDCSEIVYFKYTDKIQVWHNDMCCFQVGIDSGWNIKNTKEIVV